jgi:hypothetical protein
MQCTKRGPRILLLRADDSEPREEIRKVSLHFRLRTNQFSRWGRPHLTNRRPLLCRRVRRQGRRPGGGRGPSASADNNLTRIHAKTRSKKTYAARGVCSLSQEPRPQDASDLQSKRLMRETRTALILLDMLSLDLEIGGSTIRIQAVELLVDTVDDVPRRVQQLHRK